METQPKFNEKIFTILIEPEKPGNIGSIARSIKNFGFKNLIIVNPLTEIGTEAINYSVHAIDILQDAEIIAYPENCGEEEKQGIIDDLFKRFDSVIGTSCRIFKEKTVHRIPIKINDFIEDFSQLENLEDINIAFVFGKESSGLPNFILELLDLLINIPTSPNYHSLNLSQSVSIILYEVSKLLNDLPLKGDIEMAPKDKKDVLINFFNEMVSLTGVQEYKAQKTKRAFKSMIMRSRVSSRELTLLLGVFRVAVEKLKR
ncbi:MAG: RNA methyltransferase [Candidatus Hodarchaeota archaeon]